MEMVQPFPRARARLKHAHSFDGCGIPGHVLHRKSAIHELPVTLRMLRVKYDKSDWFWSQSIVFTNPHSRRTAASGDENVHVVRAEETKVEKRTRVGS